MTDRDSQPTVPYPHRGRVREDREILPNPTERATGKSFIEKIKETLRKEVA